MSAPIEILKGIMIERPKDHNTVSCLQPILPRHLPEPNTPAVSLVTPSLPPAPSTRRIDETLAAEEEAKAQELVP